VSAKHEIVVRYHDRDRFTVVLRVCARRSLLAHIKILREVDNVLEIGVALLLNELP
jgi:hypothetical protein